MQTVNLGDLLAALNQRWKQRELDQQITGGISEGFPKERTPRPYVTIDGLGGTRRTNTNVSKLQAWRFTLHVFDSPSETVWYWMRLIVPAIEYAPLPLAGEGSAYVLQCRELGNRILEEDYFHHGVLDFEAQVRQLANYAPA